MGTPQSERCSCYRDCGHCGRAYDLYRERGHARVRARARGPLRRRLRDRAHDRGYDHYGRGCDYGCENDYDHRGCVMNLLQKTMWKKKKMMKLFLLTTVSSRRRPSFFKGTKFFVTHY